MGLICEKLTEAFECAPQLEKLNLNFEFRVFQDYIMRFSSVND